MTIKAQDWAKRQRGLSSGERVVLYILADAINQDHEFCFPSQDKIAEEAEKTVRHVRRCVNKLIERGLIRVERGAGRGRGKGCAPTRYFLACDHRTGDERPFTTGHVEPVVSDTSGHPAPLVREELDVTTGQNVPLQADIFGKSPTPPNIDNRKRTGKECVSTRKQAEKPVAPKKKFAGDDLEGFPELWAMWKPKDTKSSTARTASAAAYARALKRGSAERILAGARLYLAEDGWERERGRFMKALPTFLNQDVWSDLTEAAPECEAEALDPKFVNATDDQLRILVSMYRENHRWPKGCGKPLELIPPRILAEFGYGAAA